MTLLETRPAGADAGPEARAATRTRSAGASERASIGRELGLLAVGLSTVVALARLTTTPGAGHVLAAMGAVVVAGHLAVAAARRRLRSGTALVLGAAVVILVCLWCVVPGATFFGVPTPHTFAVLGQRLSAAGRVITAQATPLPPISGIVLCLAAGAGLGAALARALAPWGRTGATRPVLVALVPGVGIFCYSSLLSSEVDRVQAAIAFVLGVLCFLAAVVGSRRRAWTGAVGIAVVVLAAVVATGPSLAGMRLDAIPFGSDGAGPAAAGSGPGSTVDALDLLDDLRSVITTRANELLFRADSTVATYWQMATLTSFDGTRWIPDPATDAAASGKLQARAPTLPVLAEPPITRTISTDVSLGALHSPLLPTPPGAVAVTGLPDVVVVPGVGVYDPAATRGAVTTYVAFAPAPGADLVGDGGAAGVVSGTLTPYLALPHVAPSVVRLAHAVVAGAADTVAEATDLLRFFATGHFRYSLDPPAASGDPLSSFLFDSRTGFCQQFAGAFAVLARIDGLPTRLAVGFTAGSRASDGSWRVLGADAHVWPQVYLGPDNGWVSFEPTPPSGSGPAAAGVVSGRATSTSTPRLHPNSGTTPTTNPRPGQARPGTGATATTSVGGAGAGEARRLGAGVTPWVWVLVAVVAAAATLVVRRRVWLVAQELWWRTRSPRAAVLGAWRASDRQLGRRRAGRRPAETIAEHARRVRAEHVPAAEPFAELAALATHACYRSAPVTSEEAAAARRLHRRLCRELNGGGTRTRPGGLPVTR